MLKKPEQYVVYSLALKKQTPSYQQISIFFIDGYNIIVNYIFVNIEIILIDIVFNIRYF